MNNNTKKFLFLLQLTQEMSKDGTTFTDVDISTHLEITVEEVKKTIKDLIKYKAIERYRRVGGGRILKFSNQTAQYNYSVTGHNKFLFNNNKYYINSIDSLLRRLSVKSTSHSLSSTNLPLPLTLSEPPAHKGDEATGNVKRAKVTLPDEVLYDYYKKSKTKKPLQLRKKEQQVIDFWRSNKLAACNEGTKNYKRAVRNIRRLTRGFIPLEKGVDKYTYDDIIKAITNFSKAVNDPNYEPPNNTSFHIKLKRTHLSDFIHNSYSRINLFTKYLREEPKFVRAWDIEELNSQLTKYVRKKYVEEFLGTVRIPNGFSASDNHAFIKTSNYLHEFFKLNKDNMNLVLLGDNPLLGMVDCLMEVLKGEQEKNGFRITPGWLCSNATTNNRLPGYLFKQNIIQERRGFSV